MNYRRRWYSAKWNFLSTIKDYIVPIISVILLFLLIYYFFSGPSKEQIISTENQKWIQILKDSDSVANIYYSWWNKEEHKDKDLFKWEKIVVSSGRVKLKDENFSLNLNELWDLKYLENGNFSFSSGELWVDNISPMTIEMKFAKLKISENSHISLLQNEANSTIYVISWTVEVSNLAWKTAVLKSMEKTEVYMKDASNERLTIKKEPILDYLFSTDWFVINNWEKYLKKEEETEKSTWTLEKEKNDISDKTNFSWKSRYLTFSNLLDESNVSSSSILVSWAYDTEEVAKIELNWKVAILNPELWTFKIENVSVSDKINDLVFKVFNKSEDLKEKFVYTVYFDWWVWSSSSSDGTFKVKTFDVDGSKFSFTSPTSSSTYITYDDFITIRWYVSASWIDKVSVNDFNLKSFDGKNWRYHARVDYGNLANGTNIYEIKYFSGGNMVYKNHFTIIKKSWTPKKVEKTTSSTWNLSE